LTLSWFAKKPLPGSVKVTLFEIRVVVVRFGSQSRHDPREYPHATPTFPAVLVDFVRSRLRKSITPPRSVAIDQGTAAQQTRATDARHTVALREIRPKPRDLIIAQPVKIADEAPSSGA
jgi:hypothetical protein